MTSMREGLHRLWLRRLACSVAVGVVCAQPLTASADARATGSEENPDNSGAAESGEPGNATTPGSGSDAEEPSPWQAGPAHLDLGNDIALDLSKEHAFLPKEPAARVLEQNGSLHNENLIGLVAASSLEADWFVVLRFDAEGYVKDDEEVDADDLLEAMREGNEAANEERTQRGFKPLTLEGWSDAPHYDKARHQLIWALIVSDPDGKSVNYNTRVLGRRGFVSLNLVTDPARLAEFKPQAIALLGGTAFNAGARYEDFNESTDKVAEYGLAGLIMAGAGLSAAKLIKIGLLAKAWKLILFALIAGKKFIVIALLGLAAFLKKLASDRKKNQPTA